MIGNAHRLQPAVPLLAAAAMALTGCSGGSHATAQASGISGSAARGRPAGYGGLAGRIASVAAGSFTLDDSSSGSGSSGPTTVAYTSGTTFEKATTGSLADVTTGACVVVTQTAGSDASTGSVEAASVRVSPRVDGRCTRGGAGLPGGGFPGGRAGAPPSGGFGGGRARSGGQGPGGTGGSAGRGLLAGTVASVDSTGFLVTVPATSGGSGTTTTAVTVSGSTAYTVSSSVAASDLTVGECARVFGGAGVRPGASGSASPRSAPAGGRVTAVSVSLSAPQGGTCPAPARFRTRAGAGGSSGSAGGGA